MTACLPPGPGGVRLAVFVRRLNPTRPWRFQGEICSARPDPGAPPLLTPELVQDAFEHLPFTPAAASIQPVGGRTLVHFRTYFQATFPVSRIDGRASVGPGEPRTITLLGHRVQITPRAVGYRYVYGDGSDSGVIADAGGPWPNGRVTHEYDHGGRLIVRIATTYGGTYRVDGGRPIPLQGNVAVAGRAFNLTVLTAINHLYADLPRPSR